MDDEVYSRLKTSRLLTGEDRIAFIISKQFRLIYEDVKSTDKFKYLMMIDNDDMIHSIWVFDMMTGDLYDAVSSFICRSQVEGILEEYVNPNTDYVVYEMTRANIDDLVIQCDMDEDEEDEDEPYNLCLAWNRNNSKIKVFSDMTLERQRELLNIMEAESLII